MSAHVHNRTLWKQKQNDLDRFCPAVSRSRSKHILFLRSLSITVWIVTIFLSLLFYIALRMDLGGIEWLAGLLLGMVVLGWITVAYFYHVSGKKT